MGIIYQKVPCMYVCIYTAYKVLGAEIGTPRSIPTASDRRQHGSRGGRVAMAVRYIGPSIQHRDHHIIKSSSSSSSSSSSTVACSGADSWRCGICTKACREDSATFPWGRLHAKATWCGNEDKREECGGGQPPIALGAGCNESQPSDQIVMLGFNSATRKSSR
jgi:hypothetical protein